MYRYRFNTDQFATKKMNIILVPFLLLSPFFLANTLDTRCHERHTSIVPPIVETKSPITRGRTVIKSFEIGTLPFAYDPSSFPPSHHRPRVKRTFDERSFPLLLPSQRNKTHKKNVSRRKFHIEGPRFVKM